MCWFGGLTIGIACAVGECERAVVARGMCATHYMSDWRRRNPDKARSIKRRRRERSGVEDDRRGHRNRWGTDEARARRAAMIRERRAAGLMPISETAQAKRAEAQRRRRAANPERTRAEKRRRRTGRVIDADWLEVLYVDPCSYCGNAGGTLDHIDPVSAGGTNEVDNLAGACLTCNTRKQAMPMLRFLFRQACTGVELG